MFKKTIFTLFSAVLLTSFVYAEEEIIKMDDFVITGTKTKHVLENAPVKTEIITSQELLEKGIKNVKDAFSEITGIVVTKDSGSWGNKGNIEIQGLGSDHTLILLDGVKVLGGHGGVDISSIPVSSIKQIEIVKGSASSLFGSEAIGGVINIITKEEGDNNSTFSLSFGDNETEILDFATSSTNKNVDFLLNYNHSKSDGIRKTYISSGKLGSDQYKEHSLKGSIKFKNGANSFTIKPYFSEHTIKSGVNATTWQDRVQKRTSMNYIYNSVFNDKNSLNIRHSTFDYEHYTEDRTSEWTDDFTETELSWNSIVSDTNTFTLGFHKKEEERDDKGKGFSKDRTIDSIYLQEELSFKDFTIVAGMREDDYDDLGKQKNPKFSLFYGKDQNIKYRLSYGEAFKAPELEKLYAVPWAMGPYTVISNPALKPEESKNYQFGIEIAKNKDKNIYINLFKNKVDNLISYKITRMGPPPWNMQWINVNETETKGLELTYKTKINKNVKNTFTLTKQETEDINTGLEIPYKPELKASFSVNRYYPENNTNLNLGIFYTGKRFDDDANTIELGGYTTADLTLTKNIKENSSYYVKLENLTGKDDVSDEYDLNGSAFSFGFTSEF